MPNTLNIPCPTANLCDNDNPLANLTSEAADASVQISVFFPTVHPPLGRTFLSTGCVGVCTSTISQEDADLCAARQATDCVVRPPPPHEPPTRPDNPVCVTPGGCEFCPPPCQPPPPQCIPGQPACPPPVTPCNEPVSCCVPCPDGTQFCYFVPACMFFGATVVEATKIAQSYACNQAHQARICLRGTLPDVCVDDTYHGVIFVDGGVSRFYNWVLVSGSLPPGLHFIFTPINQAFIEGAATEPGEFTFTLRATDPRGNFMQRQFTILILAITSGNPPDAQVGQPYSFQFTATGGTPPYFFEVTDGHLPAGLTLSQDGLLSGVPTFESDAQSFTVCVSDSGGIG